MPAASSVHVPCTGWRHVNFPLLISAHPFPPLPMANIIFNNHWITPRSPDSHIAELIVVLFYFFPPPPRRQTSTRVHQLLPEPPLVVHGPTIEPSFLHPSSFPSLPSKRQRNGTRGFTVLFSEEPRRANRSLVHGKLPFRDRGRVTSTFQRFPTVFSLPSLKDDPHCLGGCFARIEGFDRQRGDTGNAGSRDHPDLFRARLCLRPIKRRSFRQVWHRPRPYTLSRALSRTVHRETSLSLRLRRQRFHLPN